MWDVQKGELVGGPFNGHKHCVRSVTVSPDDKRMASGGEDHTIIIWDVEKKQMTFHPLVKHTHWVFSVCFSPNGKRLASGSRDKTVVLWDAETGTVLETLEGHGSWVLSVAFSPDGLKLASGSADRTVRVWRTENAELLFAIDAHKDWVECVVWSPDGHQLVSASDDKTAKFWNASNGDQIGLPCIGHTDSIYSLAISSDGSFIVTSPNDKTVRLWSTETYQLIKEALEHTTGIDCIAISPNGELLVTGASDGNVLLWSIRDILEKRTAEVMITEDHKIQHDNNHNSYAKQRHHAEEGTIEKGSETHQGYIKRQCDMSGVPDAVRYADQTLTWQPAPAWQMRGHTASVSAVAFFKDGRRVITGSSDHTLRIWDLKFGTLVVGRAFQGHKDCVRSVAVSPDDRRIASGGEDETIIIWDVESKEMIFVLTEHTGAVFSVCFSPDSMRIASGSRDQRVIVWDAETGTVLAKGHHRNWVLSVAFSPNGQKLASGSWDRNIQVRRANNGKLLLEINTQQERVRSVVWSHDGQQLVSASEDRTVTFWSALNGNQISKFCTGHTDWIRSFAISSDCSFIATASDDGTVRLWSTKSHQQIGQALEHTTRVASVVISPNGELLISGDAEGKVLLWSIETALDHHNTEARITEDTEAQQLFSSSYSQFSVRSHENNFKATDDHDSPSRHPSETYEALGSDEKPSLFDILAINTTIYNACTAGDLHAAEELLTQQIDADGDDYDSYSNRSVVRARNSEWDKAFHDSVKSITIQPSLLGYISKGIALCGNEQLWDAMEAFDLAFVFLNHGPITVDILLLIKAVALFNANRHDEAMRRVHDLATAYRHLDTLLSKVVKLYLRVQLAIIAFEDAQYGEAADRLNDSIPSITDLFSCRALFETKLKIFTVLFGWDLDSLWQTANQIRCDAFLRTDRVVEAVESYQYMMHVIDENLNLNDDLEWSAVFRKNCTARYVAKGDEAVAVGRYERAVELYSAGIELDFSCAPLFAHRSKAHLEKNFYAEALNDADRVIELNPSSYIGYELKHAAFRGARRHDEAIEAFTTMLSKLDDSDAPCSWVRQPRQQYVRPSEAKYAIRRAVHTHLENAPHRLLNISTGHLCDREGQINAFMESTEYKEILSSSMTHIPLRVEPIRAVVAKYFSWVMLSHRWESKEPRLHDIQDKDVYMLDPAGTMVKLQTFCKIARDGGYLWAWSDTCCIDQNNNVELQESVNSMFVWYRHSALTIVYLSDVPPLSKSGALANSAWNTRGWTVQEFLAPNVVLFYQADWTLYLGDCSPNHKESVAIMQELEHSTGINARALAAFHPGMRGAREKLRWSSSRITTLQEDIAYSLFGIFGVHLPVIYGEKKQNALGRLLQEIIAHSGDITALDWVGKSSGFNSCLPADITSYKAPPCTLPSLFEDEIQTSVSTLQNNVAVEAASKLYTLLDNLSAPRFANSRLRLPCIAFPVTEVRRRRGQDQESCFTYDVKADGLQSLLITTEGKLMQFSPARPTRQTFLLIRPWNRYDLELPDFADETQTDDWPEPWSPLNESLGLPRDNELADSEAHSRELRLIVRLGQPFGALLLAQQRGGEYKRIASDNNIIAQVRDMASVHDMMDVRTLEIL